MMLLADSLYRRSGTVGYFRPVVPGDDVETLHERIKIVERQLLVDTVNELSRGKT